MQQSIYRGKKILVAGGTGSIGSCLVRTLIGYDPAVVRIFSRDESKQFALQQEFKEQKNIRFLVGDVRDDKRLRMAMEEIDFVFHAAALKHVPSCEFNPFEAVKTNVLGTQHCIEAALTNNIERFVTISTDKATSPTNTMGATKLLAERLTVAANHYKGKRTTIFASVRFGNVIGSRGSVIPLFIEQVRKGGPVTVTDREMTRFLMTLGDAVHLVLEACARAKGGEVFVLKMPVVRLGDLAEAIIEHFAPQFGYEHKRVAIQEIGIRAGERKHEALMTEEESALAEDLGEMWALRSHLVPSGSGVAFTSAEQPFLSKNEILQLLQRGGIA